MVVLLVNGELSGHELPPVRPEGDGRSLFIFPFVVGKAVGGRLVNVLWHVIK